ncbi:TonB-dependent receptor [Acetobacter oeni]|uniref:TonB-dependent receptor n=1 Tax=Acetobacter oeni TaxID=304077 RepID=A0A511XQK0_9PROT|nr:TonB-dependent receptor [Acetobacter oeni]MBB3884826.1 iron complex outermembrane receptor protein [Acetobacter oeni]NHO20774.1 TonB-dependent receptor plug domain-containing protein [Acetobacter oeni]GBR03404.1 TonB-dependent receptor [Acetobacter oeni LMG 21952]GEN65204.1 TonB-dependent receptor [Acetobacter oeni]
MNRQLSPLKRRLLLSSAILLFGKPVVVLATTQTGSAQSASHSRAASPKAPYVRGGTPAKAAAPRSMNSTSPGEAVSVSVRRHAAGGGLIRHETSAKSVSTVSHEYIAKQSPASNALALVSLSPGANVSMGDPFGVSDQSNINVRGLNQQEIGFTFEGAPMNDPDDYTPNSSEWVDSENMESIQLQQGAPDIETPTTTSSGGTMAVRMRNPLEKRGGQVDVSYGSHQMNRQYIRYDTGRIGNTGLRGFVSFSNLTSRAWRGPGRNDRRHLDFKFIKDWGENYISLSGSYNNEHTAWYSTPSLSEWKKYGLNGNLNLDGKYTFADPNYYKGFGTSWTSYFLSAQSHFKLTPRLTLNVTPYYYHGTGNYPLGVYTVPTSGTYYQGTSAVNGQLAGNNYSQDGNVAAVWDWIGRESYTGINTAMHYKIGHHDFVVGDWYGYTDMNVNEPFSALDGAGNVSKSWLKLTDGTMLNGWKYHTITQVNALYVGDEMHFLQDRLHISVGFKEVMSARNGTLQQPGPQYNANYYSAEPLPRMSASYKVNKNIMVFANVSTSFRLPIGSAFYNQYNSPYDASLYQTANTKLRDEYSISEEVGARYNDDLVTGSVTLFNYNFVHHQINEYINAVPYFLDAGGMTSRGADAELGLRPWHHFSPYFSGEYLYATTDNNITMDGITYNTKGKIATSAPRWMGAVGLQYDDGRVFGSVSMRYVDKQYGTFMNDEHIKGYKQVDMMLGVRGPDIGFLKAPSIRLNIINLADHHYLSGVYNTGATAGTATYYTAPSFACLGTFSTGF